MDSSGVKGVMRATTDSRALYERTTEVARRHGCDRGTFSVCWGEYERGATCQCREDAKAELAEGKLGASMVHDARQILEGSWWLHDGDDLMPSRPIMFKLKS